MFVVILHTFRFLMNATLGSTPLSSPLESPDIMQTFVPISDIGAQVSMASIKVPSLDSIHLRNQQVCSVGTTHNGAHFTDDCKTGSFIFSSIYNTASSINEPNKVGPLLYKLQDGALTSSSIGHFKYDKKNTYGSTKTNIIDSKTYRSISAIPGSISELPELLLHTKTVINNTPKDCNPNNEECNNNKNSNFKEIGQSVRDRILNSYSKGIKDVNSRSIVEFSLSSVGRSFIDKTDSDDENSDNEEIMNTPDTPPPNISPSSSKNISDTFSNDFKSYTSQSAAVSPDE